jgi:peptidyl-prolyl cis-trans isomerase SurA
MIPEFSEAAFAIPENGQYSKPIRSRVGWHIIYRIDKRGIKPYDELKDDLLKKVKRGDRSLSGRKATLERLKKENNFTVNSETVEYLKNVFANKSKKKEEILKELEDYKEPLCKMGHTPLYLADFLAKYKHDINLSPGASPIVLDEKLNNYFDNQLIEYEKAHLEEKYPEFRYLMNEYYDGLLIFDISQKEVWNKASEDSTGLRKYFDEHKEKYAVPEKFKGDIFICKNKKALKAVKQIVKDSVTQSELDSLNTLFGDELVHKSGEFEKGADAMTDAILWNVRSGYKGNVKKTCYFGDFEPGRPQEFEDVKGLVIADYQTYLEKQWVNSLREKYKPVIHYDLLKKSK